MLNIGSQIQSGSSMWGVRQGWLHDNATKPSKAGEALARQPTMYILLGDSRGRFERGSGGRYKTGID